LNIFLLTSSNPDISKKIKDEMVRQVNRLAEIACFLTLVGLINNIVHIYRVDKAENGVAFRLPMAVTSFVLCLVWLLFKYKFKTTHSYLHLFLILG